MEFLLNLIKGLIFFKVFIYLTVGILKIRSFYEKTMV